MGHFFELFNKIKEEFRTELPFPILEVSATEADDIIAVLSQLLSPHYKEIIIISSDKDLLQLQQTRKNVKQYSPFHRKFIDAEFNNYDLFEHIVRGDSGDGIPNILSEDDVFLIPELRSKPIRQMKLLEWKNKGGISNPEFFCKDADMLRKFMRNRLLIDLSQMPSDIASAIKSAFENIEDHSSRKVFDYLVKHRLTKILAGGMF